MLVYIVYQRINQNDYVFKIYKDEQLAYNCVRDCEKVDKSSLYFVKEEKVIDY